MRITVHFISDSIFHTFERVIGNCLSALCATAMSFIFTAPVAVWGWIYAGRVLFSSLSRCPCCTLLYKCLLCKFLQILVLSLFKLILSLHKAINLFLFVIGYPFFLRPTRETSWVLPVATFLAAATTQLSHRVWMGFILRDLGHV